MVPVGRVYRRISSGVATEGIAHKARYQPTWLVGVEYLLLESGDFIGGGRR